MSGKATSKVHVTVATEKEARKRACSCASLFCIFHSLSVFLFILKAETLHLGPDYSCACTWRYSALLGCLKFQPGFVRNSLEKDFAN